MLEGSGFPQEAGKGLDLGSGGGNRTGLAYQFSALDLNYIWRQEAMDRFARSDKETDKII